ncbi:MAG: hypothetical protein HFK09_02750 [Clostridia bacterium]|nr:hypothetical protein [Clostridia bacterium]
MRNKIVRLIICFALAAVLSFAATGCLFEHNYEKDYMQVVATVKSVSFEREGMETFTTEEKSIYKTQLVSIWNSNASSLINQGYTPEAAAEYLLGQLVNREVLLNEAEALYHFGDLKWTRADDNYVAQTVYGTLDGTIKSIKNEVLGDHDEPTQGEGEDAETSTTYPVPSEEEPEEEDPETVEKWRPDMSSYPAVGGDSDLKSVERETVRRLVEYLASLVEDNKFATDEEKAWFEKDIEKMKKLVSDSREDLVYPMLYDPEFDPEKGEGNGTYIVEFLWGKQARETRKLAKMQEYIEDGESVTEEEILTSYNSLVATQKISYADSAAYDKAATSSTENVLYTPDDNYFYVKHILVQFSDEQKAELEAYKKEGMHSKAEIESFRNNLVKNIVGYKHIDGEDDKSKPLSVYDIYAVITSKMSQYKYNPREAERMFDKLIYDYNTDDGAFGNAKGYGVKYELGTGESETYMQEFADAARDMYDTLEVGQLYDKLVVTDYGVHIMYLASKTKAGEVKGLYDYQTPGEYTRVYDVIKDSLLSSKQSAAYNAWATEKIVNRENDVERFEKRFEDLYKA